MQKFSTSKPKTRDKHKKGLKASWFGLLQHPSPSPGSTYITFPFSFFKSKARQGTGLMDPKERTQNMSLAAFTTLS